MDEAKTKNRTKIIRIVLMALFIALIAISAQISIPFVPVPFTLQTLFVLLCGAILGGIEGFIVIIIYILMGLIGIPVFTGWTGGLAILTRPTFGFIVGFAIGALITGLLIGKRKDPSIKRLILAVFLGTIVIYIFGISYYFILKIFYLGGDIDVWNIFLTFWIIFIPTDIVKGIIVIIVSKKLSKFLY